ncbi:MAG: MerR family transcriptional regulator [Microbacterium sp. 69-10]|uniref:MerR family transcriptional regulator n=1 Tax=Microbacterium sp. 69-10 TaxID=1895783 RepID=UPI00095F973B|nr:MerR family transcriptional regulator [Microbacterium sp. 69-10]OJU40613.1 MAG: MerR family transcriptional regulator [Microbacterium sp. 69-10]
MAKNETHLTVAQMVAVTGVSAHTLRYYEKIGLISVVARNSGNQRRYSGADVEWVRFLLRLRETGMPIALMREYAELREQGSATIAPRMRLLEQHQGVLRAQLALLRAHGEALTNKITTYRAALATQDTPRENGTDND